MGRAVTRSALPFRKSTLAAAWGREYRGRKASEEPPARVLAGGAAELFRG